MNSKATLLLAASRRALYTAAALSVTSAAAWAGSLSWDGSDTVTADAQGGLGTWDMLPGTTNWWDTNTNANVAWPNAGTDNDAVFGGTAGAVTISSVTANDLLFNIGGYTLGSSTLTLNGTTPTVTTTTGTTTISSNVAGSAGLTKAGTGTLELNGLNSYTGTTTVSGGTLTAIASAPFTYLSGSTSIAPGATFNVNNSSATSGTSASSVSLFAGDTTVRSITNGGTLNLNLTAGSFWRPGQNTTINMASGGQVNMNSGDFQFGWGSTSPITNLAGLSIGSGAFFRSSNNMYWDALTGAGNLTNAYNGAVTFFLGNNNGNGTFSGIIANGGTFNGVTTGAVSITKLGSGVQTLSNLNTYTGATNVNAGTLELSYSGNVNVTANSSSYAIASGATLKLNNTSTTVNTAPPTWSKFSGAGTLALASAKSFDTGRATAGLGSGFTGKLQIEGGRVIVIDGSSLGGTTSVVVKNGGHLGMWQGGVFNQNFTLDGIGYGEGGGWNGALRLGNTSVVTTVNGTVTLAGNTTLVAQAGGYGVFNGNFSESFIGSSLNIGSTAAAAGTIVLNAPSTYTGTTTVAFGTLVANNSLTSPIVVNNGATLGGKNGSTSSTLQLNAGSNIVGTASVAGAGNAFRAAGAVTIGGVIKVLGSDNSAAMGSHTIDVLGYGGVAPSLGNFSTANYHSASVADDAANQKITLTYTNEARTWNSLNSTWDNMATTAWQEGDQKFASGDAVVFDDTGAGAYNGRTVGLLGVLSPSSITFNNNFSPFTLNSTGTISGAASLSKSGAAKVTLSTPNSFTGGTNISGGMVEIRTSGSVGTGAVNVTGGGTFAYGPSGINFSNGVTLDGGILSGGMDGGTVNNTYSGNLTLGAGGGTLTTWWSDKTLTVTQPITGPGNLTVALQQAGNGAPNIVLGANNSYAGTTTIAAGLLQIGASTTTAAGTLGAGDVFNNGTLRFFRNGTYTVANNISGTGNIQFQASGANAITMSGAIVCNNINLNPGNSIVTLGGTSANTTASLTSSQDGHGTVTLAKPAGVNALSGTVNVGNGYASQVKVQLAANEQIDNNSVVSMGGSGGGHGGRAWFDLMGNNETIAGLSDGTSQSYVRNMAASPATSTLTLGGSGTYTLGSGFMQNGSSGALAVVKNGSGTQTLVGGGITYTGATTLSNGTLALRDTTGFNSAITLSGSGVLRSERNTGGFGGRDNLLGDNVSGTGVLNINNSGVGVAGGWTMVGVANGLTMAGTINVNSGVLTRDNVTANNINTTATVNVATNGVLGTRGGGVVIGALNGTGEVSPLWANASASTLTVGNGNGSGAFSGIIHGNGSSATDGNIEGGKLSLVKTGTGTQFLSGASTFTGGTTVNGGMLIGTSSSALGVDGGLTLNGGVFAYEPVAAGALNLGSGVINLAAGSRIGAAIGGTAGQSAITSSGAAVTSGAVTVDVYGIPGVAITDGSNDVITASGGLDGATYSLGNIYNATNFTVSGISATATAVSVTASSAAELTDAYWKGGLSGGVNVWALSNGTSDSNWTTDAGGTIATSLTPASTTTVHLSASGAGNQNAMVLGANMSVNGLVMDDGSTIGVNADGNTLAIGMGGITANSGAGAVSLGNHVQLANDQVWQNDSSNLFTISGNIVNPSNYALTVTGSGNTQISSNLTDSGLFTKDGAGTLTLSGNNSRGSYFLDGGTLKAGSATAFGNAATVDFLDIPGATLDISDFDSVVGSITGGGTSGGTISLGSRTLTIGGKNDAATYSGTITGTGGVTKTGTAALTLANANSYTGATTVVQGTLNLNAAAPTVLGSLVMNGPDGTYVKTLQPNQFGPGVVANFNSAFGAWNRFDMSGKDQTLAGINTGTEAAQGGGVIQIVETGTASPAAATLTLDGSGTYVFSGHLRNGGTGNTLSVTKSGAGTQTFAADKVDYTGATTLSNGTLRMVNTTNFNSPVTLSGSGVLNSVRTALGFGSRDNILGNNVSGTGVLNINNSGSGVAGGWTMVGVANGLTMAGTINVNSGVLTRDNPTLNNINTTATVNVAANGVLGTRGGDVIIGALNGTGEVSPLWSSANAATLTVGNGDGSGTFDGIIHGNGSSATEGNIEGGKLSLVKSGTGTQTLTGANTYTGTTTVSAGTLLVNGSTASGSAVTVSATGTLGGTGNVAGTVTSSGTVAPGTTGTGTLNTGAVTLTGTYACQLDGASGDRITSTGSLTLTGATLAISVVNTPTAPSYIIASFTGSTPSFTTVTGLPSGYQVDTNTAGQIKLVQTSGYGNWATTNAPSGTPTDDFDGDGVSNALEWVLGGLAGTNDNDKLPKVTPNGSDLIFTFVRNDDAWTSGDTTTQIEVGTTLGAWPGVYNVGIDTASSSPGVTITPNGTTDTVTLTVPKGADDAKFGRLKVTVTVAP